MGLYITMYDLINDYYDRTTNITRSIPITYFYNIEELTENIYKCIIRGIKDFTGDGIYGYMQDYSRIALFIYSFDEDRNFEEFSMIVQIGYKAGDHSKIFITVGKYWLIDLGIENESFIKSLNMEIKLSNTLNKDIEYIIE